jgi:hypothetical protein
MKYPNKIVSIAGILLLLGATVTAFAQSTMQVPGPAPQYQYSAPRYSPPDSDSTPIQILPPSIWPPPQTQPPISEAPPTAPSPPPPSAELSQPAPQTTVVLPAVFRGCWQGQVEELDWIRRMPGARKVGFWTPKTYRLCYKRVGQGPFHLTFTETGVEPSDKIIAPHGIVVPVSTDGRAYATMQSTLHFDEYTVDHYAPASTFTVDERANLNCKIVGDAMLVSADVVGTRDGEPWFQAGWHASFNQVPN